MKEEVLEDVEELVYGDKANLSNREKKAIAKRNYEKFWRSHEE